MAHEPFTTEVRDLVKIGDSLFSKRRPLMAFWQECAEQVYSARASFTRPIYDGLIYSEDQMTSYPEQARREFGNFLSGTMRQSDWFKVRSSDEKVNEDDTALSWMDYATKVQMRAMYDPSARFVRASREGDHDYVAFGNAVITLDINREFNSLLYRAWHLRSVVWLESYDGHIRSVWRKWSPSIRQLAKEFGKDALAPNVLAALREHGERSISCMHMLVPVDEFPGIGDPKNSNGKYMSFYVDVDNKVILRKTPVKIFNYIIPRWLTVSESQYARSGAMDVVLPDARLLQSIERVILEAGEKFVDPAMIGVKDAMRSDVALYAGGITWVDLGYDERLGDVLRPVNDKNQNRMPVGWEMSDRVKKSISDGFFLNKLIFPPTDNEMTAFEVRQRVQEHVRNALPLMEPIEQDYNAQLCERTFEYLLSLGAFGREETIPEIVRGPDLRFAFTNALRELKSEKSMQFREGFELLEIATQIDQAQVANINTTEAFRESLRAAGWTSDWLNDTKAVEELREELQSRAQQKEEMEQAQGLAEAAQKGGVAANQIAGAIAA